MSFHELAKEYNFQALNDQLFFYQHFNWEYAKALRFQERAVQVIRNDRSKILFILTSHPQVFTMGRGLQRDAASKGIVLKDLTKEQEELLPFPLFHISRGGGLTFHHPGQLVVYPIVNLNGKTIKLGHLVHALLELAQRTFEQHYQLEQLTHHRELLGLWHRDQKIASAGVGLKHFVNHHGMAINIEKDSKMEQALSAFSPCGLSSSIYTSLEEHIPFQTNLLEAFSNNFISTLNRYQDQLWDKEFWHARQ